MHLSVQAQEPLTPLWQHVDAYGAGDWYPVSDVRSTIVTYDNSTGKIYRTIMGTEWGGIYHVQVFDTDGNDLTPIPSLTLHGVDGDIDGQMTKLIRLTVVNDTIAAIVRYASLYDETIGFFNWLKVMGTDGTPYFLVGSGPTAMTDFQRDAQGTLVLTDDEIRRFGPTGWPDGSVAAPQAEGMAVLGNDLVVGAPPSIARIDRSTMTALSPIAVPSSGTATSGICMANGGTTFNYAALNSNGIMDVGFADMDSGPIWSTTITLPAQALPTAYHVDEHGDFWIAVALNATSVATLGLLYRFHGFDGTYGVNSYGRRIDGIASTTSTLFLTGRVAGSSSDTFLAGFTTDFITPVESTDASRLRLRPNPTTSELQLDGLAPGTTHLTIVDATGRTMRELNGPFTSSISVPIADLPNGAYMLRGSSRAVEVTLPFVVLH